MWSHSMPRRHVPMTTDALFLNAIQVAGIVDRAEAQLLVDLGIDLLGFPLRLPINKDDLSEKDATEIIRSLRPPHRAVLITYLDVASEIAGFADGLQVSIVQLHGEIALPELAELRARRPDIVVIKSLVIGLDRSHEIVGQVEKMADHVDAFITDTYDPATGASGATGMTHDWSVSRAIVEASPRPVILAGGLTPENVRDAILTVRPAGVDVHSGVENAFGRKDRQRIEAFVAAAIGAFREISR